MSLRRFEIRITSLIVAPESSAIFCEEATHISIEDEAAGEYVVVSQEGRCDGYGKIGIDPDSWPVLRDAIDRMVSECRLEENDHA
jgi:hypothetical protein